MATGIGQRIRFRADLTWVNDVGLVRLPPEASERLPSRGQVAVRGTLGGHQLETVVEPDGRRGHWMRIEPALQTAAGLVDGDRPEVCLEVCLEVRDAWPEPEVPADLGACLVSAPASIRQLWLDITPMARWEWVRWVGATKNADTRRRRVEVTISKLEDGKRRPCCFDLSSCTDPDVARRGRLPLR